MDGLTWAELARIAGQTSVLALALFAAWLGWQWVLDRLEKR